MNKVAYKHTQVGYVMIVSFAFVALVLGIVLPQTGFNKGSFFIFLAILLVLSSFLSLTVTIDETYARIRFGYGIIRKRFLLKEITSSQVVKNHWYYGWGIRVWLWPFTYIYNVSGFDAVEIVMKNRKRYRIGTDEPHVLQNAITREMNKFT